MPIIYSKVTTEPLVEPITQAEAKLHLRVDNSDENDLIDILRQAAREIVEQHTSRSFITKTRTIKLDYFPVEIWLPYGPVVSVTSIKYYDEDENLQTVPSSEYWVDVDSNIPRIIVKDSWPGTYDMPNAVEIVYSCGYGASGSNVPRALKSAMLLILGHLYENREQVGDIKHEIPFGASVLMAPYVVEQNLIY